MIVDCHCHAGLGDGLTGPWDTEARLDRYLPRAARAGIDRTVLFAAFHSDYARANREVARIVASRPGRFYGFAFVHPLRDAGRVAALVREAVERHGFCGIKVHRYDARITREICDVARAYSLPVLYDVMGEVSVVELLAREYPDVKFVGDSTCSRRRSDAPVPAKCCSDRTDPGSIRASNSKRFARSGSLRPTNGASPAKTSST
jgi:hypothetical protein